MYTKVTENNIDHIVGYLKDVKINNDSRKISIDYTYKFFIDGKETYKIHNSVNGILSNKKNCKSSVYFENYILCPQERKMMSVITDEYKEKMTHQSNMLMKIYTKYICYINNIDIDKLKEYSDNNFIKKNKNSVDYDYSYEYNVIFNGVDSLNIKYKEYFLSKRAINPNWIFSKIYSYSININDVNDKLHEYEIFCNNEKIRKEEEKTKKELIDLKKQVEQTKKELESLKSTKKSYGSSRYNGSCGSSSYSGSSYSYLNEQEQSDLADRMYERSHGHSRYDL